MWCLHRETLVLTNDDKIHFRFPASFINIQITICLRCKKFDYLGGWRTRAYLDELYTTIERRKARLHEIKMSNTWK